MPGRRLALTRCSTKSRVRLPQVAPKTNHHNKGDCVVGRTSNKHATPHASMSALHPRTPAEKQKRKAFSRASPSRTWRHSRHPLSSIPVETSKQQFSSSALPSRRPCSKRYAVKRRFSEQKNARFTAALIRPSPCLSSTNANVAITMSKAIYILVCSEGCGHLRGVIAHAYIHRG
jgi:hypothetical protein